MISECLKDLDKPTQLYEFYNQESPYKYPPFLICPDKLKQFNDDISHYYLDSHPIELGGGHVDTFNVHAKNSASLHEGYARNIDLDSHLRGINYIHDNCYYDTYKINPRKLDPTTNTLGLYSNVVAPDYKKPNYSNPRPSSSPSSCITSIQFSKCDYSSDNDELINEPVYYRFSNERYCKDWSCERLFYNQTKRTMLVNNRHNRFDINPDKLCCKK